MNILDRIKQAMGSRVKVPKGIQQSVNALPDQHIEVRVLADRIMQAIPGTAITVKDLATLRYLRANSEACAWMTCSEQKLLGRTVHEVLRDSPTSRLLDAADREAIKTGKHEMETWSLYNDGQKRRVSSTRFVFKDAHGSAQWLVTLSQDVTAQHAAFLRAEDLERTTYSLLTGLPFPITWLDRRQVIKGSNLAFNTFAGFELPVNHTLVDVFPFAVAESIRQVCRSAEDTNSPMSQQVTIWGLTETSTKEMIVHVCPMHDQYGQVMGTVAALYDVTDLVESTRVNSKLTGAFDVCSDAVFLTDCHNVITYVNAQFCRQYGYKKSQLIGKTPSILRSGRHQDGFYANLWATLTRGKTWHGSMTDLAADKTLVTSPTTIVPILNGQKMPVAYLCIKHMETTDEPTNTPDRANTYPPL